MFSKLFNVQCLDQCQLDKSASKAFVLLYSAIHDVTHNYMKLIIIWNKQTGHTRLSPSFAKPGFWPNIDCYNIENFYEEMFEFSFLLT